MHSEQQKQTLSPLLYHYRISEPVTLHKYLYADADPVNNYDPSGRWTISETAAVMGLMSALTIGAVDRAAAVVDIVMGVRKMIDFVATLSDSDFAGAFPKPGKIFDFTFSEVAEEFLVLTQAGIRRGTPEWVGGYLRSKNKKLKAYIIYMPSFFWTPLRPKTVGSINGKPVKLAFGSAGKGSAGGDRERVSLMGLGLEFAAPYQLLRMDPGHGHDPKETKEIDILPGIYTHMHVYKWGKKQQ